MEMEQRGLSIDYITLHVGPGTFQPLRKEILAENTMERERYYIPGDVLSSLSSRRRAGGRIMAVGTTVTRALESVNLGSTTDLQGKRPSFIHPLQVQERGRSLLISTCPVVR